MYCEMLQMCKHAAVNCFFFFGNVFNRLILSAVVV